MPQYVYIVECADETLYTGYTTDVGRRLHQHNAGEGASYTAGRRPVQLRYVEYHPSRGDALSREHEIKSLTRAQKERLVPEEKQQIGVRFGSTSQDP